jgi:hypothetical protein
MDSKKDPDFVGVDCEVVTAMKFIVWLFADAVAVAPPRPTAPMATEVDRATAPRENRITFLDMVGTLLGIR